MKLVPNWRNAWKWISVNCMAGAAALQMIWLQMPPELKSEFPPGWVNYITATILVMGVLGRLLQQSPSPDDGGPK